MNFPLFSHFRRRRGVALLLTISTIAILAMLVIAFLSVVTTEQKSSNAFAQGTEVRNLSELPVNMVIGQLRLATNPNVEVKPANTTAPVYTWASQPGLVRVFGNTDDGSGVRAKAEIAYKLYSDEVTTVTGDNIKSALLSDKTDMKNWQDNPGLYTDLNEPVALAPDLTGKVLYQWPILKNPPKNGNKWAVDGYNLDATKVNLRDYDKDGVQDPVMPVKWLYVLQDGTIATPTKKGSDAVTVTGTNPATPENPIVGRIAYWTDDESCKINLNTASQGSYWDVPRANNVTDQEYANRIPAQNEYTRFQGHPALTSLSPVFQSFGSDFQPDANGKLTADQYKKYYELSPFYEWGGTMAGSQTANAKVETATRRLYTSVDELVFNPARGITNGQITNEKLNYARFFLTATSRAPELNLFGKPKIGLWPISPVPNNDIIPATGTAHNVKDKLLAFCCRGGNRYWLFQRHSNFESETSPGSSQTPTKDYVDTVSPASKRNRDMYAEYLQPLTSAVIPGFAGKRGSQAATFANKYGAGARNQMLAGCWDLLRWGLNSYSTGLTPHYRYLPARGDAGTNPKLLGETSAAPLEISPTVRGFGRFPTITEAALVFMATDVEKDSTGKVVDANGDGWADKTKKMRAFFILEPFSPTCGTPSWSANVRYTLSNVDKLRVNNGNIPVLWRPEPTIKVNFATGWLPGGGHSTAFTGMFPMFVHADTGNNGGTPRTIGTIGDNLNENQCYSFVSSEMDVSSITAGTNLQISGAYAPNANVPPFELKIKIKNGFDNSEIQNLSLNFPATYISVPRAKVADATYMSLDYRLSLKGDMRQTIIRPGDKVRSVEAAISGPTKGDLRFIAALKNVPKEYFDVHPEYHTLPQKDEIHSLRNSGYTWDGQFGWSGDGGNHYGTRMPTWDTAGTLVKGVYYFRDSTPIVPRGLLGAIMTNNGRELPGDWDNGVGNIEDGAYINKPDEGNAATGSGSYLSRGSFNVENGLTYSPNRQVASAVMFGSIPTGIDPTNDTSITANAPWRTLLFCPNPPSRSTDALGEPRETEHAGFGAPRDHLFLDNFWMPIVEPYAISEQSSTAGKINMNYDMMPFDHIDRKTGIYAAMKSMRLMAITPRSAGGKAAPNDTSALNQARNNGSGENYKEGTTHKYELRYDINVDETLKGFDKRFDDEDCFRSATEICEIFLAPKRISGASYNSDAPAVDNYENLTKWWNGKSSDLDVPDAFEMTGDNTREAPYNQLYPRLTTKSNVFTVHFRVQVLKKARTTGADEWVEGKDLVASEQRGSVLLERYLDPNDVNSTNYDKNQAEAGVGRSQFSNTWEKFYRYRVISKKQFAP